MTKETLAQTLDCMEYGCKIDHYILKDAKSNGLVIVSGYSNDNIEFEGAIDEELPCYEGGTFLVLKKGQKVKVYDNESDEEITVSENFDTVIPVDEESQGLNTIQAVWSPNEPNCSWVYKTDIPHATFRIMEDEELYCIGIVFSLTDVIE